MSISLKTQKMLWGLAAARCAEPNCRRKLVEDSTATDDPTLVGQNCHIIAEADTGPRADADLSIEDRNRYGNLILMCGVHHTIIDNQVETWTIERLNQLKDEHELWVEQSLGLDKIRLRDDTIYADYIDEWERLCHLDNWHAWSSHVLGGAQPRLRVQVDKDIENLRTWLLARIWPNRYRSLEAAFANFARVLQDFHNKIWEHLEANTNGDLIFTRKFYKIERWDPPLYTRLVSAYEFHIDIVSDLMLELTRAANLICEEVRLHISHSYRIKEGRIVVQRGPDMDLNFRDFVPQYSVDERASMSPYPGLDKFYKVRADRDWTIGEGQPAIST